MSRSGTVEGESEPLVGDRRSMTKGERQRQAILDCLPELLTHKPIGELTVGEIAGAAGVQRSGFYFYFESKYTALAVATAEIWTNLVDQVQVFKRAGEESAASFIRRTASTTVQVWHNHEAVLVGSIQAIPLDEQIASLWRMWNNRLVNLLVEQIQKDVDNGLASPALPDIPHLVSTLLEMTLHMFYKDRLEKAPAAETERMLDAVENIWVASVWGPAETAR